MNIEVTELKILSIIVKKHCKVRNSIRSSSFPSNLENLFLKVLREGWDRHMTFSFKLQKPDKESMIQVCSVPLSYEYFVLHFVWHAILFYLFSTIAQWTHKLCDFDVSWKICCVAGFILRLVEVNIWADGGSFFARLLQRGLGADDTDRHCGQSGQERWTGEDHQHI